jgi:hypothetical protein
MPISDHTVGSTFSRQVPAPNIDEIHIDPMIDGAGFAVCGEHLRVDVFPPDTDPDMPGAFIAVCEDNLSAEQARLVAALLLAAAEYVEYLESKGVGR